MYDSPVFQSLTRNQGADLLADGLWGFEREAQRVDGQGNLALTRRPEMPHLSSDLGQITVDFAESQAELVSAPRGSPQEALGALERLHDALDEARPDEFLWPFSMPPRLPAEDLIPIARFGDTAEGKKQEFYRENLARRYGKKMQMISGLHANFSFAPALVAALRAEWGTGQTEREFSDALYFAVARNALRHRWLLILLFGASPAADPTYSNVIGKELERVRLCCPEAELAARQYERFAVSLRVSRYGYSNRNPRRVSFDSIGEYTAQLRSLVDQGTFLKDSELYSPVRVKQVPVGTESQTEALERRGAAYLEVRVLDTDPFVREGIALETVRFLHVFLAFCLVEPWRPLTAWESENADRNHHLVALAGRRSGLNLFDFARGRRSLEDMAGDIFTALKPIASAMDRDGEGVHTRAVAAQERKIADRRLLPSSQVLETMIRGRIGFASLGLKLAKEHKKVPKEAEHARTA